MEAEKSLMEVLQGARKFPLRKYHCRVGLIVLDQPWLFLSVQVRIDKLETLSKIRVPGTKMGVICGPWDFRYCQKISATD